MNPKQAKAQRAYAAAIKRAQRAQNQIDAARRAFEAARAVLVAFEPSNEDLILSSFEDFLA